MKCNIKKEVPAKYKALYLSVTKKFEVVNTMRVPFYVHRTEVKKNKYSEFHPKQLTNLSN